MLQTLWLASWYPSKASPQNGDFIQRHANAVSKFAQVYVLHAVPYSENKTEVSEKTNLVEEIIYYKKKKKNLCSNFFSLIKYFSLNKKHIKKYIRTYGKPDIVHVHVSMRAGIVALWAKRKYKLPYIITEHWTVYTQDRKDNYSTRNFLFKYYTRRVIKNASMFLPVSNNLGNSVQKMIINVAYKKIPNVASEDFYYKENASTQPFTFIHVSTLIERKNPRGIMRSFKELLTTENNIFLKMVGPSFEQLQEYADQIAIPSNKIIFTGELSNPDVAKEIINSNAFILFSKSENLPCVIAECLTAGLPVIGTNVGGVAEMINDKNGIVIPSEDEAALTNAMKKIIHNYSFYDHKEIAKQAKSQYSYEAVGSEFINIYNSILQQ